MVENLIQTYVVYMKKVLFLFGMETIQKGEKERERMFKNRIELIFFTILCFIN